MIERNRQSKTELEVNEKSDLKSAREPASRLSEAVDSLERQDAFWMGLALAEARRARESGEVPVGAVVVNGERAVGRGSNQPISDCDPTAHAEVLALREAAQRVGNYRLTEATLYVTIEPCVMCAGAIVNARIRRLVYGAADEKAGAVNSVFRICNHGSLNHQVEVTSGVREAEGRELMQAFFRERRQLSKAARNVRQQDLSSSPERCESG